MSSGVSQTVAVLDEPHLARQGASAYRGGWSENAMTEGLTRYRVAIQAFSEWTTLSEVIGSLVECGFECGQFCLFGPAVAPTTTVKFPSSNSTRTQASVAGSNVTSPAISASLTTLLAQPPIHLDVTGHDPLEMRCGRAASQLFAHSDGDKYEANWMRPDLTNSLACDVDDGFVVLLLMSQSADQQALGARLLLRHGTRELRTHEFSAHHI